MERENKKKKIIKKKEPLALKHRDYLTLLSKSKNPLRRKKLIEAAEKSEIEAVAECIENILNGNVALTKSQLNKLRKHRVSLRNLRKNAKSNVQASKRVLKQKGGFLPMLLPLALNALGSVLGGLTK